jgi:hypothetical protein
MWCARMRTALLGALAAVSVAACNSVIDPVEQSGLTVLNRTSDTLLVSAIALTPTTDVDFNVAADAVAPTRIDSTRLEGSLNNVIGASVLAPGERITLLPGAIAAYSRGSSLAVFASRARNGYLFPIRNATFVSPRELRERGPEITLRDGRFFPNVIR